VVAILRPTQQLTRHPLLEPLLKPLLKLPLQLLAVELQQDWLLLVFVCFVVLQGNGLADVIDRVGFVFEGGPADCFWVLSDWLCFLGVFGQELVSDGTTV